MDMHLPVRGVADAITELVQKLDEVNQARTEVLKHQEHLTVQKKFADGSILRMKNVETRAESLILGSFPEVSDLVSIPNVLADMRKGVRVAQSHLQGHQAKSYLGYSGSIDLQPP